MMFLIGLIVALNAYEFDYPTLQGRFKGEVVSVMGPGVGLNAGQSEIIHVSIALRTGDAAGMLVSSGGQPDRPYKYNKNREIGFEIIKNLEASGHLRALGIKGVSQKLAIAGLPFPFAADNLIPWQGDQTKDVGLHVSLYNQPPSGQYGAKYTPPTPAAVAALKAYIGQTDITTKGLVVLNGSELNDDKAGGCYYVGLAATDSTTALARDARKQLGLKVDETQKFHITSAIVMPQWRDHRKAGELYIDGKKVDAGTVVGAVDQAPVGKETFKACADVGTIEGKWPAPQTSHWVTFRRGFGAKGPSQFDKPALPLPEEFVFWPGWDNNGVTGWTQYCDDANAISAENNKVKGKLMRTGEIGKLENEIKALQAMQKAAEFGDLSLGDEIDAKNTNIATIKADVRARETEIFQQMALGTRDILDVLGFPQAVGPNEVGRECITAPEEELQALLVIHLMGENTPDWVFAELERIRAAKGASSSPKLEGASMEVDDEAMAL